MQTGQSGIEAFCCLLVCLLAVAGIIALLLISAAATQEKTQAGKRPGGRKRPPGRKGSRGRPLYHRGSLVRPGDVWWAPFTFEEGNGYKGRPCLIVKTAGDRVRVAKITGTNLDGYEDCAPIVVPGYRRTSWIDYRQQRWIHVSELQNRCVTR